MIKEERRELYHTVFNSPQGKKVLEDLAKVSEFNYTSFSLEPLSMAHKEGKK